MRPAPLLLALVLLPLLAPVAVPQPLPVLPPLPAPLDAPVSNLRENLTVTLQDNVTHEDVRVDLDVDFRTLDFDLVGLLFGGGTFEAQARLKAHVEIRAIGLDRVNAALNGTSSGQLNLSQTPLAQDVNRTFLTADELRLTLSGEALALFQDAQEEAMADLVADAFPEMTVLSSRFEWSGTDPRENARGDQDPARPRLKDPPLVLDVDLSVQYLQRTNLLAILKQAGKEDPDDALLERLKDRQQAAFHERSAFSVLGLTQVLNLSMQPGWDLRLTLRLPEGYTFEDASPDVSVGAGHREAATFALAGDSATAVANPVLVSISNRFLVCVSLLVATLLAGAILRVPATLAGSRLRRPREGA